LLALARDVQEKDEMTHEEQDAIEKIEPVEKDLRQEETGDQGQQTCTAESGEVQALVDRLKRLQAEFENYRKRMQREMQSLEDRVSDREILDFLPLFDNMERAFSSYSGNDDAGSFIEGMEKIYAQFSQVLRHKGIAPMEVLGERFDPAKHEALLSVESDEEENVILEEFERGYVHHERLLRPSKVKVSKGKPKTEE